MKTRIKRVRIITFNEDDMQMLRDLALDFTTQEKTINPLILDEDYSNEIISILIDVDIKEGPHKDFIMEFIKELKR